MLLKILGAPVVLALSLLTALLVFLFDICAFLLTIASMILAVLGIVLFFTPTPFNGILFLFLAFLLSTYVLQAMSVSGHSRKTLAGARPGDRTFCAAAHPSGAYIETQSSPEVVLPSCFAN